MGEQNANAGWSVTLGATTYPLIPSTFNLRELEGVTECTIFSLVNAAAEGALTLDHMGLVIAVLSQDRSGIDPRFIIIDRSGMSFRARLPGLIGAIVDEGIMKVMPRIILPLTAALAGKVDANGIAKAEAS